MRSVPWRVGFSYPFPTCDHITLKEALAVKTLIIGESAKADRHSKRIINMIDSDAARGAFNKGRSSSWRLKRILKQAAPHLLGSDISIGLLHTHSEDNVADDLTRDRPLRPPVMTDHWFQNIARVEEAKHVFCSAADAQPIVNEGRALTGQELESLGITAPRDHGLARVLTSHGPEPSDPHLHMPEPSHSKTTLPVCSKSSPSSKQSSYAHVSLSGQRTGYSKVGPLACLIASLVLGALALACVT